MERKAQCQLRLSEGFECGSCKVAASCLRSNLQASKVNPDELVVINNSAFKNRKPSDLVALMNGGVLVMDRSRVTPEVKSQS
jgi:hypothetical protein